MQTEMVYPKFGHVVGCSQKSLCRLHSTYVVCIIKIKIGQSEICFFFWTTLMYILYDDNIITLNHRFQTQTLTPFSHMPHSMPLSTCVNKTVTNRKYCESIDWRTLQRHEDFCSCLKTTTGRIFYSN